MNNFMAGMLARNAYDEKIRIEGVHKVNKQLVMYVSEHAHYSNKRTAMILGLGSENVRGVPVLPNGRMDPDALNKGFNESDLIDNSFAPGPKTRESYILFNPLI